MADFKADLKQMKGISAKDAKMLADAEILLGPDPAEMGFVQNLFWGRLREDLILPYPRQQGEERARCDALLERLDAYLRTEHPAQKIDRDQEIPAWVIERLAEIGVLGMTIPEAYGGLGFGTTSYVRVLEKIGEYCGSTAVLVSAHQSVGCKAIVLFGSEEQKQRWLPGLARGWVSAFCLSEPNLGCDAGGQETRCEKSADGTHYILNGEKKWATSGALSQLFTVMAKQQITDPKTGRSVERVSALVCTPDMPGVEIFERNRSKCGIRGTWQARIRFTDVKVPASHLLHQEGKGLNVALTCLNYGRCTLSAGMLGGATRAMGQAVKWARTRHQFDRPIADFELVQLRIARMAAWRYAMDAMLYMTTGFLDRHDADIRVETAICKTFCSEYGWRIVNDAMQLMGGEGYMTENEVERIFRDSRINLIVEGANEVMQAFIFGYGGKALAEQMVGVQERLLWSRHEGVGANIARIAKHALNPRLAGLALGLGAELYLGVQPAAPTFTRLHPSLAAAGKRFAELVRGHSRQFKQMSRVHQEKILDRQVTQARLADSAILLHAMACVLARRDEQLRAGVQGLAAERDAAAATYFLDWAGREVEAIWRTLADNADATMRVAAAAQVALTDSEPNARYVVPERSPTARGTGRRVRVDDVPQFGQGSVAVVEGVLAEAHG
jgi:alkylation response protein AidB-like acyl-CoA dehydrogenase